MKPKLHIHSDNARWAGSENMPGVFLQSKEINDAFDVSFSYRYTPEYEEGMGRWAPNARDLTYDLENPIYPLRFPVTHCYKIRPYFKPIMALGYSTVIVEIVKMFSLLKRIKPDVLHVNNGGYPGAFSCNSAAVAGKLAGVPKITYMVNNVPRNPWWFSPVTWAAKRSVSQFISGTEYNKSKGRFLQRNNNWVVISNTILPLSIQPRNQVREMFGIPEDEVVFLCIGELREHKGFYRVIDALTTMKKIGIPRSLLLAGRGPEEDFLKNRMKSKKRGVYRYYGDDDIHPYALINACDALVVPSIANEDLPNVVLIAQMYGKPCIVSDLMGLPEICQAPDHGLVFNTDEKLSDAMDKMLDRNTRGIMGQKAKANFERKCRPEKIVNRYIELWKGE